VTADLAEDPLPWTGRGPAEACGPTLLPPPYDPARGPRTQASAGAAPGRPAPPDGSQDGRDGQRDDDVL